MNELYREQWQYDCWQNCMHHDWTVPPVSLKKNKFLLIYKNKTKIKWIFLQKPTKQQHFYRVCLALEPIQKEMEPTWRKKNYYYKINFKKWTIKNVGIYLFNAHNGSVFDVLFLTTLQQIIIDFTRTINQLTQTQWIYGLRWIIKKQTCFILSGLSIASGSLSGNTCWKYYDLNYDKEERKQKIYKKMYN